MSKTLAKNLSLYTFGQFLSQALAFLLLPIYIKELSTEDYGIVASLMAFGTFTNALMQYGFSPTVMRYYYDYKDNPEKFKAFLSALLLFMLGSNFIVASGIIVFDKYIFGFLTPDIDISLYIYFVVGYSVVFTFPLLNFSLFRVEGKAKKFFFFNLVQFFISFAAIYFFLVILKEGALGKIKGEFWARVPLFILSFYLYKNYFTFRGIKITYLKKALNFGIPLMLQAMLWWGLYRLDYFLIARELGNESLGLYNVAFQLSFVLITIGISFSLGWTPHFFSIAKKENTPSIYGDMMGNYFMLITIISIGIYFFSYYVLLFLGGEKYLGVYDFFQWLLIGALFQSSYFLIHQTIQYSKKTWSIPLVLSIGILVGFVIEYAIIKSHGLLGISIVKALIFLLVFVATFFVGQKHYRIKIPRNKIYISLVILALNFALGNYLDFSTKSLFIKLIMIIISVVSLWYVLPFFNKAEKELIKSKIKFL